MVALQRLGAGLAILVIVMTSYVLFARPYQLSWGATSQELKQAMPGDELEQHPEFYATRAITIAGTPQEIWPWLLQMGYGRAGYYGYDILENLGSERGIRSADRIIPEFQSFKVGDEVPISSVAKMYFHSIVPDRHLIWTGKGNKGSFLWALHPVDEGHTRLVSRIRWSFHWSQLSLLSLDLFTEFADFLAVRKILQGVKGRVEGNVEPFGVQAVEAIIYIATALMFVYALVVVLLRPFTWGRWTVGLMVGALWLMSWYSPMPSILGGIAQVFAILKQTKSAEKGRTHVVAEEQVGTNRCNGTA